MTFMIDRALITKNKPVNRVLFKHKEARIMHSESDFLLVIQSILFGTDVTLALDWVLIIKQPDSQISRKVSFHSFLHSPLWIGFTRVELNELTCFLFSSQSHYRPVIVHVTQMLHAS